MGTDRPAFERDVDDFQRRVDMRAGLPVGARAVAADPGLDRRDLPRKAADRIVGLGQKVFLSGPRMVALGLELVAGLLVAQPRLPPGRHPEILGGALQARDDALQFVDILDHRQPEAIEAAAGDDERVLIGREAK